MASQPRREPHPSFLARAAEILRPGKRGRSGSKLSTVPEKGPWSHDANEKSMIPELSDSKGRDNDFGKGNDKDGASDHKRYARTVPRELSSIR